MSTDTTATPEAQAPAAAEPEESKTPPAPAGKDAPKPDAPKPGDPADSFKSEESKNAVLADLKKVRDENKALKEQFEAQGKAIAAAFGLTEAPKSEDLAETVEGLQKQIAADRHAALLDRLAAANGIDEDNKDLLTETDPEKLKAQAVKVGALIAANKAAETPEFQANPGQGQGGTSSKEDDSYPSHWVPKRDK